MTGQPLFPGDSDLHQLSLIIGLLGALPRSMEEQFARNGLFSGAKLPQPPPSSHQSHDDDDDGFIALSRRYPTMSSHDIHFMRVCACCDFSLSSTLIHVCAHTHTVMPHVLAITTRLMRSAVATSNLRLVPQYHNTANDR